MNLIRGDKYNFHFCETCQEVVEYAGEPLANCPRHGGKWTPEDAKSYYVVSVGDDAVTLATPDKRPIRTL